MGRGLLRRNGFGIEAGESKFEREITQRYITEFEWRQTQRKNKRPVFLGTGFNILQFLFLFWATEHLFQMIPCIAIYYYIKYNKIILMKYQF